MKRIQAQHVIEIYERFAGLAIDLVELLAAADGPQPHIAPRAILGRIVRLRFRAALEILIRQAGPFEDQRRLR